MQLIWKRHLQQWIRQKKKKLKELVKTETPNIRTIEELTSFFNISAKKFAKTLIFNADGKIVAVMVRGDREVNETKVSNDLGGIAQLEMASAEDVFKATNAAIGFAGPIGIKIDELLVDEEVANMYNFIVGANETGFHLENANYGRDFEGRVGDYRNITIGEKCPTCGSEITIARGTEVGHIFKLGTKYSETMKATFMDENGKDKPFVMGCYGIGVTRTMASVIEQHHDEYGITWPLAVAPYHVSVIPVNIKDEAQMEIAEKLYNELRALGVDALLDNRNERAGVKFKDSELIGIPMRITVGKKIGDGEIEFKLRTKEVEVIRIEDAINKVKEEFEKNNFKL